jgi:hypothetical protein
MFKFNKKEFSEEFNEFKKDIPQFFSYPLLFGAGLFLLYMAAYWLPSHLSAEQCNEIPSIGGPLMYWLLGGLGLGAVGVLIVTAIGVLQNIKTTRKPHKRDDFYDWTPHKRDDFYDWTPEQWKEWRDEQTVKENVDKARKAMFVKWFPIISTWALIFVVATVVVYSALSNYYCWQ